VPEALAAQTGRPVILVLAVGLALYAVFSAVDSILHHDDESPAAKRWGDRALSAWGFVMYAAFSVYTFHLALSSSRATSSAQDQQQKAQWSAKVLQWPAGWLWLSLLAVLLIAMALFLVSRAWRRSFRPRLDRDRMGRRIWQAAMVLGAVGYLGRAGLFAIVGGCVLSAAVENDPRHGQGVDGSLRILADSTAGTVVLWLLTATLLAYGLYMFIETRYRYV
jgi:Trk-type K+ transport system membrane component